MAAQISMVGVGIDAQSLDVNNLGITRLGLVPGKTRYIRIMTFISSLKRGLTRILIACAMLIIATSADALEEERGDSRDVLVKEPPMEEQYEAVVEETLKALESNPKNEEARRDLTEAYFRLGEFEQALKEQKALIEIAPELNEAHYFNLGLIYHRLGDNVGRLEAYRTAATNFGSEGSWGRLAVVYSDREDYKGAIDAYRRILELDGDNIDARRGLALNYLDAGEFESALGWQKRVIELAPEPAEEDYYDLGVIYNKLGDNENKLQAFLKAATLFGSEDSWHETAIAYVHLKDYHGAVAAYRKTVELNPDNEDARYHLIRNLCRVGDYEGAKQEISNILNTKKKRIVFAISFLKPLAAPFLLLSLLCLLPLSRRLVSIFFHSSVKAKEMLGVSGPFMLAFVLSLILPHIAFNPFAPHYGEKVVASIFLFENPPDIYWRHMYGSSIALVAVPALYMKKHEIPIRSLFAIDLKKIKGILVSVLWGILLLFAFMIPIAIILGLLYSFQAPESVLEREESARRLPLLMKLYSGVGSPFIEEFCFRGWIFLVLKKYLKVSWSILFSSLLFMAVHYYRSDPFLAVVLAGGIVCALLVHKTGSLWPSSILHAINNSFYLFRWF